MLNQAKERQSSFFTGLPRLRRSWDSFRDQLSESFRVIVIDLAGHGKSESLEPVHSMELQADVVYEVLKQRKVKKCLMIGHSMGGYVTLAFASKYPEMLKGLCLFHSHPFPDSPEDRKNRNRTINVVEQDKFGFVARFIPSLFPEGSRRKFGKEIKKLVRTRYRDSERRDHCGPGRHEDPQKPVGTAEIDQCSGPVYPRTERSQSPLDRLWKMVSLPQRSECLILRNVGHMGYIEAPEETLRMIKGFARKVFKKL